MAIPVLDAVCLNPLTKNSTVLERFVLKSAISCMQTAKGHNLIVGMADTWVKTAPCHQHDPPGAVGPPVT